MIDTQQQITAVRRDVGGRVLEAGEARTVTIGQSYRATVDELWDACTNAERIPRWFLPISGDLRLHGRFQLEGNASGTIESCDPPRSFTATWESGGRMSWIEVRVSAEAQDRARLEIEHIMAVEDEVWLQFGPGAVGVGWDMALVGLATHLESGDEVDRQEAASWVGSEDGKRFMAASSERWRDASIAAGDDPDQASEAAQRTTSAYMGSPDA